MNLTHKVLWGSRRSVSIPSPSDPHFTKSPSTRRGAPAIHRTTFRSRRVAVALISSDNTWYATAETDQNGKFVFDSQEPGKYVLGLNYPASADWFNGSGAGAGVKLPPVTLFYPSVWDRSSAFIIRLASDEKLDELNFVVPRP